MEIDLVSLVVILVSALTAAGALWSLQSFVRKRRMSSEVKRLEEAMRVMFVQEEPIQSTVNRAVELENGDMRMALIRLMVEMEGGLRRVAKKLDMEPQKVPLNTLMNAVEKREIIPESVSSTFKSIWEIRNKAVHGLEVTDEELKASLLLVAGLLLAFKQIWPDSFPNSPPYRAREGVWRV